MIIVLNKVMIPIGLYCLDKDDRDSQYGYKILTAFTSTGAEQIVVIPEYN